MSYEMQIFLLLTAALVALFAAIFVMMKDGLADAAAAGSNGAVSARDIAELLAGSLAPTQPAGRSLPVIQ